MPSKASDFTVLLTRIVERQSHSSTDDRGTRSNPFRSLDDAHFELKAELENKAGSRNAEPPFEIEPKVPVSFTAHENDGETEYRAEFSITANFPEGGKPDVTDGLATVASFLQWSLRADRKPGSGSGKFCYTTSKVYKGDAPTVIVGQPSTLRALSLGERCSEVWRAIFFPRRV